MAEPIRRRATLYQAAVYNAQRDPYDLLHRKFDPVKAMLAITADVMHPGRMGFRYDRDLGTWVRDGHSTWHYVPPWLEVKGTKKANPVVNEKLSVKRYVQLQKQVNRLHKKLRELKSARDDDGGPVHRDLQSLTAMDLKQLSYLRVTGMTGAEFHDASP